MYSPSITVTKAHDWPVPRHQTARATGSQGWQRNFLGLGHPRPDVATRDRTRARYEFTYSALSVRNEDLAKAVDQAQNNPDSQIDE